MMVDLLYDGSCKTNNLKGIFSYFKLVTIVLCKNAKSMFIILFKVSFIFSFLRPNVNAMSVSHVIFKVTYIRLKKNKNFKSLTKLHLKENKNV